MHDDAPESAPADLPAIEFSSPGRFAVHNPASDAAPAQSPEAAPFRLGEHQPLERFEQPQQARAHALALLQQARRSLCLYSPDLEPWLYHHSSVQDACTRFLLANPRNRLRILVGDSTQAVRNGHRLITLSRRLSSNCLIRRLNPDYPREDDAFLLADEQGLLLRPHPAQPASYACYRAAGRVRQLQARFERAWNTSLSDPDLRSLLL
ncbi:histone acetyltransferase HPA2 [Pseudomonas paraeruginosa]|uniref:DUF7931 domain-containing protein n=1 Tax=Pseudomonas aeruginosa group TaxID=136841 RepID=UPI00071BA216|nr:MULTISPECIES: hypothetical protein [Pseudomonas aeruginosa group]KSF81904.1 histone acetyltransferase HPA2 [Pseudomonas aeruginosa]PTC37388.1 Histone acetyltransferase HPA2-like protein [Pseudomonas aeruginosa]